MTGPRRRIEKLGAPRKPAAPFRCRLVVMAKMPVAGGAKTRLAREIGVAAATRFARQATAALLQRVTHDPRWRTILAVAPDAGLASRCWPRGVARIGQGRGDLGRRMQRIMERVPPGPVVIVGTDVPGIEPAHIAEAFRRLGRHDAVFGPATDGGYWLVGLKRRPRLLHTFANVRWSSRHALADTLANLEGRSVALLATLSDVDDAGGFALSASSLGRRVLPRISLSPSFTGRGPHRQSQPMPRSRWKWSWCSAL
jgi:rSAM/selenodomain-associated transferase 1